MAEHPDLRRLLSRQDGVVTRPQLLAAGFTPEGLRRLVRRRELVRVHDGVFVGHTGELSWRQRVWVGVLHFQPAAAAGHAALRLGLGQWRHLEERRPIEIAVPGGQHLRPLSGYTLVRVRHFDEQVLGHTSPPRLRPEHAVLTRASGSLRCGDELGAIGLLADACQTRGTTAARIADALDGRPQLFGRGWLRAVLADIEGGTTSVLEHGYLTRVERPHGLPEGRRQLAVRTPEGMTASVLRDVDYAPLPVLVELDGGLFHDHPEQRDRDLDRDLDALAESAAAGRVTIRLGWAGARCSSGPATPPPASAPFSRAMAGPAPSSRARAATTAPPDRPT